MQHCGCSDLPSFRNANFPTPLTAKDGTPDILHSRKHHKVHITSVNVRREGNGDLENNKNKAIL